MIKVGVIGATGYAGSELLRILYSHCDAEVISITSQSYENQNYSDVYQNYNKVNNLKCSKENILEMSKNCDVIFIALPHGIASGKVSNEILENTKIIDLGADFRISDVNVYENWYGVKHLNHEILKEAVYGLCEINRDLIKNKRIIANPGCYTTCSILTLYPLVKEKIINENSIIIDAKSGVTGAGRSVNLSSLYCEVNESVKSYKVASHRHTPEIEEQLSIAAEKKIKLNFTPHLIPMNRGILATCYADLNKKYSYEDILSVYKKYYSNEFFIRIMKENVLPETKFVKGSNFFDIGFKIDERTNRIISVGAIDNLVKGAAGQAVQNMNILFNIDEKTGLDYIPPFPV